MPVNNPRHSRFFWRSSAMFCILDSERRFKEVNAAWETSLGLTTGQMLAKKLIDLVHPDDQPPTQYHLEQLEVGHHSVTFSCRLRHYDGSYRQLLWEVNTATSTEYAYYGVAMDITGREQPMVADEMINVLHDGVVLQYANGTIGAVNPSAERILNLPADQMMGWTLVDPDWKIIHEDGSPFPAETHPAICTLRTGQPYADVIMGVVRPDSSITWIRINSYPLWRDDVTTPYAVVISFSDISQLKEDGISSFRPSPLEVANSRNSQDLWVWDLLTNDVNLSPRWKNSLGYEAHELPNRIQTWFERIHPSDYKKVMSDIQNVLEGSSQYCENTHRLQCKDGSYRWFLLRIILVRCSSGKPQHIVGTLADMTEPRSIEEEIQDIEKKYRQIMELENDAILLIDTDSFLILDLNKAATQLYGYSRNQLLSMKAVDLSAQPDKTLRAFTKGSKFSSHQYHKRQDGGVFPAEVSGSPFVSKGKPLFMVMVRDTTEQQRLETALWESESKYRQLFEAASNPTVVFDSNSQQFFDVNRAAIELYGYSKEEFLQMATDKLSAEQGKRRAAFGSGNKRLTIPLRWHKKKDGSIFPVEIFTGSSYLFQGRSLVCATVRDITERKAHEEALRKERDFINTLVQASPAYFCAVSTEGKIRMINQALLNALEYTIEEVLNADFLTTLIPEEERSVVATEIQTLTKTMQPSLIESQMVSKNGKILLIEWHSRAVVKANGTLEFFFGVGIDVTERRKAQGQLRLFKSIIETSAEAIMIRGSDNELVYINPAFERLFQRNFKEAKEITLEQSYPLESLETYHKEVIPSLQKGQSWEGELEVYDKDGGSFPIWERVDAVRDSEGNIVFNFSLMHDISERKRMWETLRKQWEEHQLVFNTIPAMVWYKDSNNRLVRANKLATTTFGTDDIPLTDCEEIIQLAKPEYDAVQQVENRNKQKRWIQLSKIPYHNSRGEITGVIVFAMDITEQKQYQVSLQASEERLYTVVENMPMILNAFDAEGNILMWNRAAEEITGYRSEEIIGRSKVLETLYPDPVDRRNILTRWFTQEEGKELVWEARIACKEGLLKTIAWSSVAKQFPIPGWYTWHLGQDVTLRKRVERASRESEALLSSAIEITKLGLCLTDDRGRFVQVNRAYSDLYGYAQDDLVGQPFTMVIPASLHGDAVRKYYSILMAQDEPISIRSQSEQHRNGQVFNVQIMSSRVILEDRRRLLLSVVIKAS